MIFNVLQDVIAALLQDAILPMTFITKLQGLNLGILAAQKSRAYMSARVGGIEDDVADAGYEQACPFPVPQKRTLHSCKHHLCPARKADFTNLHSEHL